MSDLIKCNRCKVSLTCDKFKIKRNSNYTKNCIECLNKNKKYMDEHRCPHGRQCKSRCKDCIGHSVNKGKCSRCLKIFDNTYETEIYNGQPLQTCMDCRYKCFHGNRGIKDCSDCKKNLYKKNNEKRRNNKCIHNKRKILCVICEPISALHEKIRSRIHQALTRDKKNHSLEYVGCSVEQFKEHIEKQFKQGMSWDNYGKWHIDHIIPLKYKENNKEPVLEDIVKRLHYTNTQTLWSKENIQKGNRYIG